MYDSDAINFWQGNKILDIPHLGTIVTIEPKLSKAFDYYYKEAVEIKSKREHERRKNERRMEEENKKRARSHSNSKERSRHEKRNRRSAEKKNHERSSRN